MWERVISQGQTLKVALNVEPSNLIFRLLMQLPNQPFPNVISEL